MTSCVSFWIPGSVHLAQSAMLEAKVSGIEHSSLMTVSSRALHRSYMDSMVSCHFCTRAVLFVLDISGAAWVMPMSNLYLFFLVSRHSGNTPAIASRNCFMLSEKLSSAC